MSAVLEFDGVSVAFGRVRAARGVTFTLHRGRTLALVGESGSGKSVTAMAALGLLPPSATVTGSIRLSGAELLGAPPAVLRSVRGARIGTIFQEPMGAWNPVHTIGAQIAEAVTVHRRLARGPLRDRVRSLLADAGLDEPDRVAASYPHQLSGGQLQRAMIAMALSGDPEVLIADEPTTALDVTVQAGILALLRGLRDTAILLITHDMGVVADLADDVVVLRSGAVVESAPVERLFDAPSHDYTRALLAAVPSVTGPFLPSPVDSGSAAAVSDLSVHYGRSVRAVDGVSLDIPAGTVVGLVGESGSGKSTIGRALAGLAPITSGTVTVGGVDVGRARGRALRAVRSRIGVVFQDPAAALDPRRTVRDSIAEPLALHSPGTDARARVDELLTSVRLDVSYAGRYPHELSGGQRQRVVIARALALRPALLIADEPTSALDVSIQADVLALLAGLQREYGFACLFVSHDLAVVRAIAHRVAVLHRGTIVEQGSTADVLSAPSHPYTRRLLDAAPIADPRRQRAR
ncbi:peptide/nickel transport system ATP-binding protein [Catenuloplanes nepalensis]|uniref:Peptide/nickel transport system ATP-binding protein n=1 Tax=Catenuloplanes nepalensis TaxID=587533 RepID=A0ABT9MUE0_9ACTN|nr:ABC transporter ATP-binding protein [Catenuloplanes nepalensis]MDP9795067.1 peptide/nickel transport system ATP-binding protein [Catenuloplanes nepalensis]